MNRWVGGLTAAVVGLLLVLGWNKHAAGAGSTTPPPAVTAEADAGASPAAVDAVAEPAPPVESVRIEHELVHARTIAPAVPARASLVAQPRRAEPRPESRRFVLRASRMIVGNGRYRPEPFPRPATR